MENKSCPKCGSNMQSDKHLQASGSETELVTSVAFVGDKIRVYYCENCGFMELYRIKSVRYAELSSRTIVHKS